MVPDKVSIAKEEVVVVYLKWIPFGSHDIPAYVSLVSGVVVSQMEPALLVSLESYSDPH
jgi:hypothetical protein